MDLGNKISALRRSQKLQQKDLAAALNIARSTLSNYERNFSMPDVETLKRIAEFFHVSINYLLEDDITPMPVSLDKNRNNAIPNLSNEEEKLLYFYNKLSPINKYYLNGQIATLIKEQENYNKIDDSSNITENEKSGDKDIE